MAKIIIEFDPTNIEELSAAYFSLHGLWVTKHPLVTVKKDQPEKSEAEEWYSIAPHKKVKKSPRVKLSPEEKRAKKLAYAKEYYKKHPEKYNKLKQPIVTTTQKPEPKPYGMNPNHVKTENQQRIEDNRQKEDANIKNSVVYCPCVRMEKFVKGMGVEYKGKEFYKNRCLEDHVNRDMEIVNEPEMQL